MQTYSDMITQLEGRIARRDLASLYPQWVATAEKAIVSKLRVPEMERVITVAPSLGYIPFPDDFLAVGEIRNEEKMSTALRYTSPKGLFDNDNEDYTPEWGKWSVLGGDIYIRPTFPAVQWATAGGVGAWAVAGGGGPVGPGKNYFMRYFASPVPLGPTNETNKLFPRYSDIYFYGTLWQAFSHVRNFESADRYLAQMSGVIDSYNEKWASEQEGEGDIFIEAPICA